MPLTPMGQPGRRPAPPLLALPSHPSSWVTPRQLAEYWGVSSDTVVRYIVCGYRADRCSLPVFLPATHKQPKAGRSWREWAIRREDALRFEIRAGFNVLRMRVG